MKTIDQISVICSKAMAFVYVWIRYKFKKKSVVKNGKILLLATGHIGNAILDASALYDLKEYYIKRGKKVYLLCSETMWDSYTMLRDFSNVHFIGGKWHYHGNGTGFSKVKDMLSPFRGLTFETAVMTLTGIDYAAYYLLAVSQINEVYGVFDDIKHTHGGIRYYFERCFTNKIYVPVDMQEQQRLKLLLETLGVKGHKARICHIECQGNYESPQNAYITVSVDSMNTQRRWPYLNFIKLIEKLLEKYTYDVYLTGNKVTDIESAAYEEAFADDFRVKNLVNKTSFKEWIELIRGAKFHIGVDSGSIHVAASTGTLAFCLSGVWDAHRVLPYRIDEETEGTIEPVCIYRPQADEMPCYACKVKGGRFGRGNRACYRACQNKRPCLCLQDISVERVTEEIGKYFNAVASDEKNTE